MRLNINKPRFQSLLSLSVKSQWQFVPYPYVCTLKHFWKKGETGSCLPQGLYSSVQCNLRDDKSFYVIYIKFRSCLFFFFHSDQRWLKLIKTICPICHHDKAFHQLWPRCVSNTTSDLTVHRLHFNHYKGFVSKTFILVDSTSIVTITFLPVMHKALAKLCSHMWIIVMFSVIWLKEYTQPIFYPCLLEGYFPKINDYLFS